MTNNNKTILKMAMIQQAVAEMHKQNSGLCAINSEGVHLLEDQFVELFKDNREDVERKDLNHVATPYYFSTHCFGVKFYCISTNADLFPMYPVEELAADIIDQWESQNYPTRRAVYYIDGGYRLQTISVMGDEIPIYTAGQHTSEESISLEQAILDHMEAKYNG